jgi:hypothetical protein
MPSVSPPSVSRWFAITIGSTRRYPMEPSWSGSSPVVPAIPLVRFAGNSLNKLGDCGRWGGRDCRQGFAAVNRDLVAVGVGGAFRDGPCACGKRNSRLTLAERWRGCWGGRAVEEH